MTDPAVKKLLTQLAKPHWTLLPTSRYVQIKRPEDIGTFNLFWVLQGKFSTLTAGFMQANLNSWFTAVALSSKIADNCPIHESAVTLPCDKFYEQIVLKFPQPFLNLHTERVWEKMFNAPAQKIRNVRTG